MFMKYDFCLFLFEIFCVYSIVQSISNSEFLKYRVVRGELQVNICMGGFLINRNRETIVLVSIDCDIQKRKAIKFFFFKCTSNRRAN